MLYTHPFLKMHWLCYHTWSQPVVNNKIYDELWLDVPLMKKILEKFSQKGPWKEWCLNGDFSVVNEAKVVFFLEFPCFFYDEEDAGNLISGSSFFSKSNVYIWKFLVHTLLKSSWKDSENNLASMWTECNCLAIWTFFGIAFLWNWKKKKKNCSFPIWWALLSFLNLLAYWVQHFHSIIF